MQKGHLSNVSPMTSNGVTFTPTLGGLCRNNTVTAMVLVSTYIQSLKDNNKQSKLDDINWNILSANPAAEDIMSSNIDRVCWSSLATNPSVKWVLDEQFSDIVVQEMHWFLLSENPGEWALDLLERHPSHINMRSLCGNTNPRAELLLPLVHIDWFKLSTNSADWAIKILKRNINKIRWAGLCANSNDWAGEQLIEHYQQQIKKNITSKCDSLNWESIAINPAPWAADLLRCFINETVSVPLILWVDMLTSRAENTIALCLELGVKAYKNVDKPFPWHILATNPTNAAMNYFETHPEDIEWISLCMNKSDAAFNILSNPINSKNIINSSISSNEHIFNN